MNGQRKVALLVTGSREGCCPRAMEYLSNAISHADVVVVGDAAGVDALARRIAEEQGKRCLVYRADWEKHGKRAGPIRNGEMVSRMLDLADDHDLACLAIPAIGSRGTWDCARQAAEAWIEVTVVRGK